VKQWSQQEADMLTDAKAYLVEGPFVGALPGEELRPPREWWTT